VPKLIEFKSRQDAVDSLRKAANECAKWFRGNREDVPQIVNDAVSGNTFRAFQRLPEQPSVVFRSWAAAVLDDERLLGGR